MLSEQARQLIDKHFDGTLSDKESRQFSEQLRLPEFREALAFEQILRRGMTLKARKEELFAVFEEEEVIFRDNRQHDRSLKKKAPVPLSELVSTQTLEYPGKMGRFFQARWILAATSVLLLVFLLFLNRNTSSLPADRLFAQYFSPYQPLPSFTETFSGSSGSLKNALLEYGSGNFGAASRMFREIPDADSESLSFFQANALLALDREEEAVPILESLIDDPSGTYTGESRWYLALAYLKSGQEQKGIVLLKDIAGDEKGYKARQARELINLLK